MVDLLEAVIDNGSALPKPSVLDRLEGWSISTLRTLIKRSKEHIPGSHNRPEFQRHRYPRVSLEEIRARLSRFRQALGSSREVKVKQRLKQFFEISG
jgi:hypothetical protein